IWGQNDPIWGDAAPKKRGMFSRMRDRAEDTTLSPRAPFYFLMAAAVVLVGAVAWSYLPHPTILMKQDAHRGKLVASSGTMTRHAVRPGKNGERSADSRASASNVDNKRHGTTPTNVPLQPHKTVAAGYTK
ncbi:MAG: hypothetical protein KGK12_08700, partial [Armatimonadetes bacterium]|nr:hypothetical protein [Armatimonadota bacterium]